MKKIKPVALQINVNKRSTSSRWLKKLITFFKYAIFCFSQIFMIRIMESKFGEKNIFESGFDSFEFDDGFFLKMDSDSKRTKKTEKQITCFSNYNATEENMNNSVGEKNVNNCDVSLFLDDLNETDLFDLKETKNNQHSPKADHQENKKLKKQSHSSYPSPVLVSKCMNNSALFSSTPAKQSDSGPGGKGKTSSQQSPKISHFDFSDVDLFDDWNLDEINAKSERKETVTFSQALKLIEEAETGMEPDRGSLNQSIDLLTGDIVSSEMGDMFEESFDLPESCDKKPDGLISEDFKTARNIASEPIRENHCFGSDDDFDYLTQDLLEKSKKVSKHNEINSSPEISKTRNLNDSTDAILKKKRRKCFRIIESDTSEESPSPTFKKQNRIKKRKNFQDNFRNEFLALEADVSDEFEVSCDETEEEGEYDKSFLDEESYCSQNREANMTAKYLESVKTVKRHGSFKIPETKPFNPVNVFSQCLEETNTDYEINSFCVNDVEEELKTDLSDLEVAEKVLEMDRKKRKRKRIRQFKN